MPGGAHGQGRSIGGNDTSRVKPMHGWYQLRVQPLNGDLRAGMNGRFVGQAGINLRSIVQGR